MRLSFRSMLLPILAAISFAPVVKADDVAKGETVAAVAGDANLKSLEGKELEVFRLGAVDPTYRFLIQGGLHGNEKLASEFVTWLARRYARGESMLNLLPKDSVAIDFLPYANPDGTHGHSRYNGRGVNLNRNFGVLWGLSKENPGAEGFSEPETRAIRQLFEKRKYAAAIDVHGYINWVVAPSEPDQMQGEDPSVKVSKAKANAYHKWIDGLKKEMALLPGYQLKTAGKLGDGGAFEDWAFWSQGTMAFCLEIESFQRHTKNYRRDFNDITKEPEGRSVDTFMRYEMFVYRMFQKAFEVKEEEASFAGR